MATNNRMPNPTPPNHHPLAQFSQFSAFPLSTTSNLHLFSAPIDVSTTTMMFPNMAPFFAPHTAGFGWTGQYPIQTPMTGVATNSSQQPQQQVETGSVEEGSSIEDFQTGKGKKRVLFSPAQVALLESTFKSQDLVPEQKVQTAEEGQGCEVADDGWKDNGRGWTARRHEDEQRRDEVGRDGNSEHSSADPLLLLPTPASSSTVRRHSPDPDFASPPPPHLPPSSTPPFTLERTQK